MILETSRLYCRMCRHEDLSDYLVFWDAPETMKFIGDGTWDGGADVVESVLAKNIASYQDSEGLGFWGLIEKQSGQLIGEAGLSLIEATGEVEAGYIVNRENWGKGYGTEILDGLLRYGFNTLGLDKIIAVTAPENLASMKVARKCRMSEQGTGIYHNRKSIIFSKKRED